MNYQSKSQDVFAIRTVIAECKDESVKITFDIVECENKNNECLFSNKLFSSVSYDMIVDETIFMPICTDDECYFCICSLNIEENYINNLKNKIKEIINIYIDSKIEAEEQKYEDAINKINKWNNVKERLIND